MDTLGYSVLGAAVPLLACWLARWLQAVLLYVSYK